jgi:hypothetical protein
MVWVMQRAEWQFLCRLRSNQIQGLKMGKVTFARTKVPVSISFPPTKSGQSGHDNIADIGDLQQTRTEPLLGIEHAKAKQA